MPATLSVMFREHLLALYQTKKHSYASLASVLGVGVATVNRIVNLFRKTGSVAPAPHGGGRERLVGAEGEAILRELISSQCDATLAELARLYFASTGSEISISSMAVALERMKVTRKKKTIVASEKESDTTKLLQWHFKHLDFAGIRNKLVFCDETGANLSMTRTHGRGVVGKRVIDSVPRHWGETVTIIAGMCQRGMLAPIVVRGSMNTDAFVGYIEQCLAPQLQAGDILVLDNLSVHKAARVFEALSSVGAVPLFLPPYSPELNAIEFAWSKLKAALRSLKARTFDALVDAVATAFSGITDTDIANWTTEAGY